jgi:hypothetical protein
MPTAEENGVFEERWADFLANDPTLKRLTAAATQAQELVAQANAQVQATMALFQNATHPRSNPIPITNVSSWTIDALREHFYMLREADIRFGEERDRRYAEVNVEKEKALKIKETADLAALELARQIQEYKDEKANELRTQIESERGSMATKEDVIAAIKEVNTRIDPVAEYVSAQQGRSSGAEDLTAREAAARAEAVALRAVRAGNTAAGAAVLAVGVVVIKAALGG